MSTHDQARPAADPREYDATRAAWIAERVSEGESLRSLHRAHPETVPLPLYVRGWIRDVPAFRVLMERAEEQRAESLADEAVEIADDEKKHPATARNAVLARHWLASALHRTRYGNVTTVRGDADNPLRVTHTHRLSDAELERIARGEPEPQPLAIPGGEGGTHPNHSASPGVDAGDTRFRPPQKKSGQEKSGRESGPVADAAVSESGAATLLLEGPK